MVSPLPAYLTDQTQSAILQRMLDALPANLDKSQGGFVWDMLAPASIELALAAIWAQQVLQFGFAQTTYGSYLDLRAEEHGITRLPARAAAGVVTLTGAPGTLVPAGTRVSTASTDLAAAILFRTLTPLTIGTEGMADAAVVAVDSGATGNVGAGTVLFVVDRISGLTGVKNAAPITGGLDAESDAALLARYLQRVQSPSAGGNKADYVSWALAVAGVGGVSVVPVKDGPGTVRIAIIDQNKGPASQSLVDDVQNYIAPPWVNGVEAESITIGGAGGSLDTTQPDASGGACVKLVYSSDDAGALTESSLHAILQQPGIWQARVRCKVDGNSGTGDLLQLGIYSVSAGDWAVTTPSGTTPALATYRATDLGTSFQEVFLDFYWNGSDLLELRGVREQSDQVTMLWVDRITYRSIFSQDSGEAKAPIGARVTVVPATSVLINVTAGLALASGYDRASVCAAVQSNIAAYLHSTAFASDNTVRYTKIGEAILNTTGVRDYTGLTVNGGSGNIAIDVQAVPVLGTVTLN